MNTLIMVSVLYLITVVGSFTDTEGVNCVMRETGRFPFSDKTENIINQKNGEIFPECKNIRVFYLKSKMKT